MGQVKDLALLSVMSIMFVATFFLFMMMLVGYLNGGVTEQYDLNHYGEGLAEVVMLGIGMAGGPFVISNYIYGGR